jgi:hypothetical protein
LVAGLRSLVGGGLHQALVLPGVKAVD